MLECREACKLLSEAQDRKLTPRERLSFKLHLLVRIHCRRYRRQLAFLRVNLKKWQQKLPRCRFTYGGRTEMTGFSLSDSFCNFEAV